MLRCGGTLRFDTTPIDTALRPVSARTTGCKNDPKLGKKARSGRPLFANSRLPVFLCYLLLEKLSKSLIPRGDCPFVLNRPPCFSWKISLFPAGAEDGAAGRCRHD